MRQGRNFSFAKRNEWTTKQFQAVNWEHVELANRQVVKRTSRRALAVDVARK